MLSFPCAVAREEKGAVVPSSNVGRKKEEEEKPFDTRVKGFMVYGIVNELPRPSCSFLKYAKRECC